MPIIMCFSTHYSVLEFGSQKAPPKIVAQAPPSSKTTAVLRPTARVCIYSDYGLDPYWPKPFDSQATRIACSGSVPSPPEFDSLRADKVHQPLSGIVLSDALGLGIGSVREFGTLGLSYLLH